MRSVRLVGVVLLTGAALIATARPASACSCATRTDTQAFGTAQAVFTAVLVEVQTPDGDGHSSADPERFVVDVDRVYKGDVHARQSVVTARGGASCGLEISGRGPFLVYAGTQGDGVLTANLCGGTRPLAERQLPALLGTGVVPRAGSSITGAAGTSTASMVPPLLAGGAAATIAAVFLALRRGR